jgi:hypothetical protein
MLELESNSFLIMTCDEESDISIDTTTDWTTEVRFQAWARDFSALDSVQTVFGAHPSSYPMGIGGSFPGD